MTSFSLRGVIRDGRVEVEKPIDLPDGTEVIVTTGAVDSEEVPMSPEEIKRILTAMQRFQPLEIPEDVAADLDAWERQLKMEPR
jgi:hypothetical protein